MNYKPLKKIGIYEFLPIINGEKQERMKGERNRRKKKISGGGGEKLRLQQNSECQLDDMEKGKLDVNVSKYKERLWKYSRSKETKEA